MKMLEEIQAKATVFVDAHYTTSDNMLTDIFWKNSLYGAQTSPRENLRSKFSMFW